MFKNLHGSLVPASGDLLLLQLLLAHLFLLRLGLGTSEGLLLLDEGELDVAGRGHVGVDPTVGPVSSTSHLGGTVHLDVINDEVVGVQSLVLRVALGVLEHVEEELAGLERPTSLTGAVDGGLSVATNTTGVAGVWDDLFLFSTVLKVVNGPIQLLSLDCLSNIVCVLVMNAEVRNLALGGFSGFRRLS